MMNELELVKDFDPDLPANEREDEQRKKPGEPRSITKHPNYWKWVESVNKKHPEVWERVRISGAIDALIKNAPGEEIPINTIPIPKDLLHKIISAVPGIPHTPHGEKIDNDGWDAWFLWYNFTLEFGIYVTPGDVAKATGRPENTVKSEFRRATLDIRNFKYTED
jgi:hypothetical protein